MKNYLLTYNPDYGYPQLIDNETKEVIAETSHGIIDYLQTEVWDNDESTTFLITQLSNNFYS